MERAVQSFDVEEIDACLALCTRSLMGEEVLGRVQARKEFVLAQQRLRQAVVGSDTVRRGAPAGQARGAPELQHKRKCSARHRENSYKHSYFSDA